MHLPMLPGGFALTNLLWEVLFPLPFALLYKQREKLGRLFLLGLAAYFIVGTVYELMRLLVTHTPEHWVVLGPRVLSFVYLVKLVEEKIFPHEKERAFMEARNLGRVRLAYAAIAVFYFLCLVASFLWPWF